MIEFGGSTKDKVRRCASYSEIENVSKRWEADGVEWMQKLWVMNVQARSQTRRPESPDAGSQSFPLSTGLKTAPDRATDDRDAC